MICNPPTHDRSAFRSSRSIFRLASRFYRPLVLSLAAVALGPAAIAQNIFNCPSFSTTGACGITFEGSSNNQAFFSAQGGGTITGGAIDFVPAGATHNGASMWYQTRLNVQAFSTTFTFVPNGYNFAFVIQNVTDQGNPFTDGFGAGGEGGFSQFAGGSNIAPNNVWALSFDSGGYNTQTQSTYTNGGVQIYQSFQVPALPLGTEAGYLPWYPSSKVSVSSPFSFTSGTQYTPTGHTYGATVTYDGNNVTLNMWDVTAGGSCPGSSCFTHTWQGVYIPAVVAGTTAVVGFTSGIGLTTTYPLYVNSFSYTANTPATLSGTTAWNANAVTNNGTASAASPVYSVAPGTYAGTQNVSISTSTAGAYICYALSASAPNLTPQPDNNGGCSGGTLYSGPISVSSSATLYAMAGTSNAADPSTLGPPSSLVSGTYTIGGTSQASTPTFSPAAGTYLGPQTVTLSTTSSGAVICYNTTGNPATNGSTGCAVGTLYTGPVAVPSSETLYAVAGQTGYTDSAVGSASYVIQSSVATPTFSPAAGTYGAAQSVTLSDATSGATVYYTADGSTPTTSSAQYTGPITVSSTETLQAIAVATGDTNSAVASAAYTIQPSISSVATPAFSPAAGAYTSTQSVSISDTASGATIHYTTDGTTPTTSSNEYTGPITVSSTETLQAIAAATGDTNSAVASAAYTIQSSLPSIATPAFLPAPGNYTSAQSVTISDATSGATIYYSTNGTTPTTSSTKYTGPITVSSTETLQAIAVATGDSAVASAAYTITAPQPGFLLAVSSPSLTVDSGGQNSVTLTVTPVNGFDSGVVLACSGLPAGATCAFDHSTVTPSGAAATTQLTISTSSQSSALHLDSRPFLPFTALAMTVSFFGWRKRRCWHKWLLLTVAFAGLGLVFGCNKPAADTSTTPSTPTSTSMVTVTAISGNLQQQATIALTVN